MAFIAAYWWVWLIGLLLVAAAVGIQSMANFVGLIKDLVNIVIDVRAALRAPKGQRRREMMDLALVVAREKIEQHLAKYVITMVLIVFGSGFGILLILALVQHTMVYMRSTS